MKEVTIQIEGMSCKSCAAKIEKAIASVKGVAGAVDFAGKSAKVEFVSSESSVHDVIESIQRLGYRARSAT
ncbi:heavy-metal-associated domain-containing protein [Paenibacillus sp.]|uniref:heavy-metal-associated domain-containing protein n=1 Tax=Paenibacillus sp. TaxID=58172 RepID=UPI002D5E5209|nr:heavy-metal-associated domain-containing protein [Paenibacillus sp.]HZG88457.1 heavy-metal-associated domain-containing protein [Paenibacillus sp.]